MIDSTETVDEDAALARLGVLGYSVLPKLCSGEFRIRDTEQLAERAL